MDPRRYAAARDVALRDAIERVVLAFPGYGYRRVTHALVRDGWAVNHKRVLRVMRQEALLCEVRRRFVPTTDSSHGYRRYPNLLAGLTLVRPDQAWVAEIVRTQRTKAHGLTAGAGGNDGADFHLTVRDDHAVTQ